MNSRPAIALVVARFGEPVARKIGHDEPRLLPEIKVNAAGFARLLTHLRDLVSNERVDERAFADVRPTRPSRSADSGDPSEFAREKIRHSEQYCRLCERTRRTCCTQSVQK